MRFLKNILRLFAQDIAMDLGTANTLLFTRKKGIVVNEPSVVDIDTVTGEVLSVGAKAKSSRGRTPIRIRNVRPLRDGVIADFDVTTRMIVSFIHQATGGRSFFSKPSMVISVPTGVTQVERRAVINAAKSAGAMNAYLVEEPMASAIGAGLPIFEARGSMIADIGGGTTEVAVISLSAIACSQTVRVAGDAMNEAIINALHRERFDVGENTAEQVKIAIGSAIPVEGLEPMLVAGKDMNTGCPTTRLVTPEFVCEALQGPVDAIGQAVMRTLEETPPALAADLYDDGITMAGGGALLRGIDEYISRMTGLRVNMADDPLTAVLRGAAEVMMNIRNYPDVFLN